MSKNVYSVSLLIDHINYFFKNEISLNNIRVFGKVVSLSKNKKHLYFDLKNIDSKGNEVNNGLIHASIFNYSAIENTNLIQEGSIVLVLGNLNLYAVNGSMSLIVSKVHIYSKDTVNQLFAKNLKICKDLGYDLKKIKIPEFPNKIGIITKYQSDAYNDIIYKIKELWPLVEFECFDAPMQNVNNIWDLCNSIELANNSDCDLLIIARGGGNAEDLMLFNELEVAKAIYNRKLPMISGIGHEKDQTVVDYIVDCRQATPTAAIVSILPNQKQILSNLNMINVELKHIIKNKINSHIIYHNKLKSLFNSIIVSHKNRLINNLMIHKNQLFLLINKNMNYYNNSLSLFKEKLLSFEHKYTNLFLKLENIKMLINSNNPNNILKKGYTIIYQNNKIIKSAQNLDLNKTFEIKFFDKVIKVKENE